MVILVLHSSQQTVILEQVEMICLCKKQNNCIPLPPAELSPVEYKEKHMVLVLNLLDTDHHKDYAVEILQQYGKVCVYTYASVFLNV